MGSKEDAGKDKVDEINDGGSRKRKIDEIDEKVLQEDIDEQDKANKIELKKLRKQKLMKMKEELAKLKQQKSLDSESNGVYVSRLPNNYSQQQIIELFNKYGTISEDITSNEPRVKMYYDSKNQFTGEALVFYYNSESVELSIQMLDGIKIENQQILVEKASKQHLQQENEKLLLTQQQRKLLQEKKKLLTKKLTEWEQDQNFEIVIANMFRIEELTQNKSLQSEIILDIEDECKKLEIFDSIKNITFNKNLVNITFDNLNLGQICMKNFNNRYYDGLKLKVTLKD